ncbi:hypothetical protein [Hydromonas duriensis]|uniref:Restriction endonuclease n=1 Tax=Hydromonas duriensis TaxID=1527608 RepID=A0A4R6Y761_9BURK|nr:hypothetical protein [Hydromonas duriensis]TDR31073.1 hypothetical protein DFR44_11325 [Hydromonas duriensis]
MLLQSDLQSDDFKIRMRSAVSFAWQTLSKKIGHEFVKINKEASLQLQYAVLLNQLIPLIQFSNQESYEVELEHSVQLLDTHREIDVLFVGKKCNCSVQRNNAVQCKCDVFKIAIEMKCYREFTTSGNRRGASDIFMKDVYFDWHLLESYIEQGKVNQGVALVMNELENFVNPSNKDAKCWDYDISNDSKITPKKLTTPIGGKEIQFELKKQYSIDWKQVKKFWFLEVEGRIL